MTFISLEERQPCLDVFLAKKETKILPASADLQTHQLHLAVSQNVARGRHQNGQQGTSGFPAGQLAIQHGPFDHTLFRSNLRIPVEFSDLVVFLRAE